MKIKTFTESTKVDDQKLVYCVISQDHAGFIMEDECKCFYQEMMAADYIIKEVNEEYDKSYEPFYDNDGSRFFLTIKENKDWEKCLTYLRDEEIDIELITIPIMNTPRNI